MKDVTLPLAGVKVVEICNVAAGPFCGMLLADLGAEVIKIENPVGGDTMRAWPPHTGPAADTFSENFASLNRNKQSVSLDLKSSEGKAAALALTSRADVLVENNRPGVLERLGLGFENIRSINPRIIYCSISAYGQRGPRAAEGGFDVSVQAISGIMSVTGEVGGSPVKAGIPISDFSAGLYASYAISAQLRRVAETGTGVHIDVPMVGTSLAFAALQTSEYFGSGNDPVKLGSAHPRNAPYQAFKARNDYFVMAAGTDSLWQKVCQLLNREHLLEDPRFTSTVLRAKHQTELKAILEEVFAQYDARDLIKLFADAGVPCVPINTYSAAVKDPQVEFMGWVEDLTLPNGVETKTIGFPLRFDGAAPPIRLNPPKLGQHSGLLDQ
jgi:crotonobetainyl-CoA:carnitine CoA-transferase CaiB-like acyl-CoA transferase